MTTDTRRAIRALVDAAQRARREGMLAELASLHVTLRWYEGALAYQQLEAARGLGRRAPRTMKRSRHART